MAIKKSPMPASARTTPVYVKERMQAQAALQSGSPRIRHIEDEQQPRQRQNRQRPVAYYGKEVNKRKGIMIVALLTSLVSLVLTTANLFGIFADYLSFFDFPAFGTMLFSKDVMELDIIRIIALVCGWLMPAFALIGTTINAVALSSRTRIRGTGAVPFTLLVIVEFCGILFYSVNVKVYIPFYVEALTMLVTAILGYCGYGSTKYVKKYQYSR